MLPVESVFNVFVIWINVVQDCVSVDLVTCCEYYNLKVFVCFFETFHNIRSDVDTRINCLLVRKVDLKDDVWILGFNIINTMY